MECNPGASLSLASVQGSTVHGSGGGAISADHRGGGDGTRTGGGGRIKGSHKCSGDGGGDEDQGQSLEGPGMARGGGIDGGIDVGGEGGGRGSGSCGGGPGGKGVGTDSGGNGDDGGSDNGGDDTDEGGNGGSWNGGPVTRLLPADVLGVLGVLIRLGMPLACWARM